MEQKHIQGLSVLSVAILAWMTLVAASDASTEIMQTVAKQLLFILVFAVLQMVVLFSRLKSLQLTGSVVVPIVAGTGLIVIMNILFKEGVAIEPYSTVLFVGAAVVCICIVGWQMLNQRIDRID